MRFPLVLTFDRPSATEASVLTIRVKHRTSKLTVDPCIGTVNKSVDAILRDCETNTSESNTLVDSRSLNVHCEHADAKLELESNAKKSNGGFNGIIFVRIEAIAWEQVGQEVIRSVRKDIERGQVDHGGPGPSRVGNILGTVDAAVAVGQSDLVQSLEVVLGKIKVIADVTVYVMDEVSKARLSRLLLLYTNILISRYIHTPMRLGRF